MRWRSCRIVCYLLFSIQRVEGQTLNATLAHQLFTGMHLNHLLVGAWLAGLTITAESALLLAAAQTGFIDGPRVMAYMAIDSWLPRRLAMLSERLTIQNGVLLIGGAGAAALAYTRGHVDVLVVMYSIDVFATFSLSETGMVRFWIQHRRDEPKWKRHLSIHATGLALCFSILCVMLSMKFTEGGWLTVAATLLCIGVCFAIRRHYRWTTRRIHEIEQTFEVLPDNRAGHTGKFDPQQRTAIVLVDESQPLAKHCFLSVFRLFPEAFHNVIFASVGIIDSGLFKGGNQVEALEKHTKGILSQCIHFAEQNGVPAHAAHRIGTDMVQEASELCLELFQKYPGSVIFAGELAFDEPRWCDSLLYNETAYAIQHRLRVVGVPVMILPVVLAREESHSASR